MACGRPPQRRDKDYHGDVCAFPGCGRFFCQLHLDTHPHAASGVSMAFPAITAAIGLSALAASTTVAAGPDPSSRLQDAPAALVAINRFLNVVSPGAIALYELRHRFPSDTFETHVENDDRVLELRHNFFTTEAVTAVAGMALRSVRTAFAALSPALYANQILIALGPWIKPVGDVRPVATVRLGFEESLWLMKRVTDLRAAQIPDVDLAEYPPESDREALTHFLLTKRDEGQGVVVQMR
jgi:hypothetical protein